MAKSNFQCPACLNPVSRSHLRQHLTLSTNPACQRHLAQLDHNLESTASEDERHADPLLAGASSARRRAPDDARLGSDNAQDAMEVDPLGDYFGDYASNTGGDDSDSGGVRQHFSIRL